MQSENLVNENIDKIATLFPNCVTEGKDENGKLTKMVDFDLLKQELSKDIVEGNDERYTLNWAGKKQAILTANSPINATLRPCREESVDFDNTKNLYIEGDNLDVLKLLRETYLNKIKMIYIDPPYNTGNDFVYEDDFATSAEEYLQASKSYDEQGNRMFQNNESNGRFHSDLLSMIYSRLKIARDLLTDDGVIFISIDDHEQENMKKVCGEIFGECNFIAQVIWERAYAPVNLKKHFSESHDYILCFAKNIEMVICNGLPRSNEANDRYANPDNDPRGLWKSSDMSVGPRVEANVYEIVTPSGRIVLPPSGRSWRVSEEKFKELVKDNRIYFGADGNNVPAGKRFLSEVKQGMTPMTLWKYTEIGHSQDASKNLMKLFDNKAFFDYPKPVNLIKRCLQLYSRNDSIIVDFFSGSATTAHAVMKLNAEDGGNRKFIMVQLPEKCDEKSEAYKAGYKNICEIGKERIRRAGQKIAMELAGKDLIKRQDQIIMALKSSPDTPRVIEEMRKNHIGESNGKCPVDIGFRVLKLDSSNMKEVYYNPSELKQSNLFDLASNIKEDRSAEDLLFQVMLDMGVLLSSEIKVETIAGKKVFNVNDGNLVCCFDENLTDDVVTAIAKMQPLYAVFRDSSMKTDSVSVNFDQIFETYSPTTTRKII